jgi:hypothetical protein
MLKVKPHYLSKRGKREFVVLTVEDFDRINAALEDAADLRDLRDATRKNAGKPYLSAAQVQRQLAGRSTPRKRLAPR